MDTVCSNEMLTVETSAVHQTSQAKNIPYQPLLIKPIIGLFANAEKKYFFSKLHYDFTTDKVCNSLKFVTQPVVIEPKPFDLGYKS